MSMTCKISKINHNNSSLFSAVVLKDDKQIDRMDSEDLNTLKRVLKDLYPEINFIEATEVLTSLAKKLDRDSYNEGLLLNQQIKDCMKKLDELRAQKREYNDKFILENYGFAPGDIVSYTYQGKNYKAEIYNTCLSTTNSGVYLDEIIVYLINKKGQKTYTSRHLYDINKISNFQVLEKGLRHLDCEEANK